MAVNFELPADVEARLRAEMDDLDAEIREASVLELFRRGKLSHFELSRILNLDRVGTDSYLLRHNVLEGSITTEDLDKEARILDGVLGTVRR